MQNAFVIKDLENFIENDSNLAILEDCLHDAAQEYIALHKRKQELDFGEKLTLERSN